MNQNRVDPIVEHCWLLIGWRRDSIWYAKRVNQTNGEPAAVEFDGQWALEREESHGDVVGFYHTHPSGSPEPSHRDVKTMRAWAGSFGKPLLCLIDTDEAIAAYRFDDDQCKGKQLPTCKAFPNDIIIGYDGIQP